MIRCTFILQGDLASLAGKPLRSELDRQLPEPTSVKDALEALGIPHTEVDLLLLDGGPVNFSSLVQNGNRIEVHPTPPADPLV